MSKSKFYESLEEAKKNLEKELKKTFCKDAIEEIEETIQWIEKILKNHKEKIKNEIADRVYSGMQNVDFRQEGMMEAFAEAVAEWITKKYNIIEKGGKND